MPNFFRSFFRVRAAKLCSGLALTGLSLLAFAPTAFAGTSTLDTYLEQHPDEIPFWIEAGLLSKGVTSAIGPSAGQIAGQAGNTGVGIVFPDETGRLSRVQGYSPSEIQKGLQRLADRYCLQNPVDCYGVNAYYFSVVNPGSYSPYTYAPGDRFQSRDGWKIAGPVPICEIDYLHKYIDIASNYVFIGAPGTVFRPDGTPGLCIDLGTLKAIPNTNYPKTFGDLTPEQKRKAIALATPADFNPNPGPFEIPSDGTRVLPNGAPIFFPDPLRGGKLRRLYSPLPSTLDDENAWDEAWDEFERSDQDTAEQIAKHLQGKGDPERLRQLGVDPSDIEALKDKVDEIMSKPTETWEREADKGKQQKKATAYVDSQGRIVIDNPGQPTALQRDDYADYLTKDGFTRLPRN
jgi:hypothetical protein